MIVPAFSESNPSGAVFSNDRLYRYLLWRQVDTGAKTLLVIGLNPSYADESTNDPTIRRCVGFAKDWGFSRLLVANLFAFCATKPYDLRCALNPIGPENDQWLSSLSELADLTLVAWGNDGLWEGRYESVLKLIKNPYCLGFTKRQAPRHPLYVRRTQCPIPYKD